VTRGVQLVLLCEDQQQEVFARRFLSAAGWDVRRMRVERAPAGQGSAEQFVRQRFPKELTAYRHDRSRVTRGLIVVIDGDRSGGRARLQELDKSCQAMDVPPRQPDEQAAVLAPTWNIETWLAYLDGQEVDESRPDDTRLPRPRDCQRHAEKLWLMCQQGAVRIPAPESLVALPRGSAAHPPFAAGLSRRAAQAPAAVPVDVRTPARRNRAARRWRRARTCREARAPAALSRINPPPACRSGEDAGTSAGPARAPPVATAPRSCGAS
jgi:hypothetical protein